MKNILKKIVSMPVILTIQCIVTLFFIYNLFHLGILPMMYACFVTIVLILLCILFFFLMKGEDNIRTIVSKVISLLISILLLVASSYISKGKSAINTISGANKDTYTYSLIVLDESSYYDVKDLTDKTVGVNTQLDLEYYTQAVAQLEKANSSLNLEEINDFTEMAKRLYEKKIDAIFVNEAYRTMLESDYPDFTNDTRVIWSYSIDKELGDFSKNVDVTSHPFVIYISGIDTFGKVSTISRSDVNMIVTVNPTTKQILMTSIPRDYYVTLDNMGKKDKLTHSGLAGIENTVKTVENFMNIDINYYARVNFSSLIQMVDALGGIEVEAIEDFSVGNYSFKKGINQLNGEQALYFARARYTVTGGDNGRVANQQRVLTGMLKKMMTPVILTNYSKVLDSIEGCFETNMESNEITSLIQMQLKDMSSWTFVSKQLSGSGAMLTGGAYMPNNRLYYMIPNEESVRENKAFIEKVINGETIE